MDDLEQELRAALRRKEPSADFTARVLARAQASSEPERRVLNFSAVVRKPRRFQVLIATAAAACLLVVASALVYRYLHSDRSRGQMTAAPLIAEHAGTSNTPVVDKGASESVRTGSAEHDSDSTSKPAQTQEPIANNRTITDSHLASFALRRARLAKAPGNRKADLIEGERAKQQLELALYIASSKLNQAERVVSHVNQDDEPAASDRDEHRMER